MFRPLLVCSLAALVAAPAALAQTVWIAGGPMEHDGVQTRAAAIGA